MYHTHQGGSTLVNNISTCKTQSPQVPQKTHFQNFMIIARVCTIMYKNNIKLHMLLSYVPGAKSQIQNKAKIELTQSIKGWGGGEEKKPVSHVC